MLEIRNTVCELFVLSNHSELGALSRAVVLCLCPSEEDMCMCINEFVFKGNGGAAALRVVIYLCHGKGYF